MANMLGIGVQAEKSNCMAKFNQLGSDVRSFFLEPNETTHMLVQGDIFNLRDNVDCNIPDKKFLDKVDDIMKTRLSTTGELQNPPKET